MLNKKQNLKSGKSKDKEKELVRKKKRGNQQKWERIDEEKLSNWIFWCCSFHETKAKKKEKEKETKTRNKKETKKERQEGRNKEKKNRETEKEKVKKGEAKKG